MIVMYDFQKPDRRRFEMLVVNSTRFIVIFEGMRNFNWRKHSKRQMGFVNAFYLTHGPSGASSDLEAKVYFSRTRRNSPRLKVILAFYS